MGDYSIPTIPQKKATESAGCDVEGAYYDWLGGGMSGRNSSRAVVFAYASRLEIGLTMGVQRGRWVHTTASRKRSGR